jgi:hypothetical protein
MRLIAFPSKNIVLQKIIQRLYFFYTSNKQEGWSCDPSIHTLATSIARESSALLPQFNIWGCKLASVQTHWAEPLQLSFSETEPVDWETTS